MLQGSLFGRAEGKRTIDVQANLLSERLNERQRVLTRAHRKVVILTISILVGVAALPGLFSIKTSAGVLLEGSDKRVRTLRAQIAALSAGREGAVPAIAENKLVSELSQNDAAFLGQLSLVLNCFDSSSACASARAEIAGGTLTIGIHGDATDSQAVRGFVSRASKGPGTISAVLSSTRSSDLVQRGGVSFDFVKKVRIGR